MTLQEAIVARHSVRQYLDKPIEASVVEQLNKEIALCNQEGRLHIQLVTNEPKAFSSSNAFTYGKFSGVSNYFAMVGSKGADEAIGYYGERLVLLAQTLGLNSCWVGLTFKKQPDQYTIASGEKLHCVIALGYGATQGVQHPMRPMEKFLGAQASRLHKSNQLPDWFRRGMEAALLAPTAVNQQKFEFELVGDRSVANRTIGAVDERSVANRTIGAVDDNIVAARVRFTLIGYGKMDLGIVKYHFEVAVGKDNFTWK